MSVIKMTKKTQTETLMKDVDVVDLILLDHLFMKECISVLTEEGANKKKKMKIAKGFLDAVAKHSLAEKKSIYAPLEKNAELHFSILEAEIEHGIVDKKVKLLRSRLAHSRTLSDEVEAELKVLAELVNHHLKEEESDLLPKMREEVTDEELKSMGEVFMKLRKFDQNELRLMPQLEDELMEWRDSVQKTSSQFLKKMDKFVENLRQ